MSTRRRTYWNGDDNDMSRFIIGDYRNTNTYSRYDAVLYDMKLGVGKTISIPNGDDYQIASSALMTTYDGVVYATVSRCGTGQGTSTWLSRSPEVGENIVTYIENLVEDDSAARRRRTLIMNAENGVIGRSYHTLVDSETGQLYAFCISGSSSANKFNIMKLDSSYNITSVNSLSITSSQNYDFDYIKCIRNGIAYGLNSGNSGTYPYSIFKIDLESTTYSITKLVSASETYPPTATNPGLNVL